MTLLQPDKIILRQLGLQPYAPVSQAMHNFTDSRTETTPDELWLVQHHPVFTQGQAGKAEHVLMPGDIPVVQSDRGGQVTYHGPGQQVMYVMVDLKRNKVGVRQLVTAIEDTVINTLAHFRLASRARPDAPGVYVPPRPRNSRHHSSRTTARWWRSVASSLNMNPITLITCRIIRLMAILTAS